jgi:hypothetical protein
MKEKRNFLLVIEKILPEAKRNEKFLVYLSLTILFIISLAYLFFFGKGIFFYQENNSLFIFSSDYIQKFTSKPGGLLVYAGNFLTQFYFNSFYGSIILSSLLFLFYVVLIKLDERLTANRSFSLLFLLLTSCLLLLLQTNYDLYVHQILGLFLTLLWFVISIGSIKPTIRFIFICLFPVFYYLVGAFVLIYIGLYIIYSVIYEKESQRYYFPAFLIGMALLTFLLFKYILFLQPLDYLLGYPLFFNTSSKLTRNLYLFSGLILICPLLLNWTGLINIKKKFERIIPSATILILFPVTLLLLYLKYDPRLANIMKLEKSVFKQDWDAVIKQQERSPSTDAIGQFYYNLALSEEGKLCDRMFFSNQDFGPMALTLPRDNQQAFRAVYYYYAIGLIGEAHHLAYELMVQHGYRPENIKLLIKTELINGNYKIAGRYINVLKKTLLYKNWAEKYEKMLFNPSLISSDPELGRKIRLLPAHDFFVISDDVKNLELFLKINPENKMAFEYKVARLLLEKDLLEAVSQIKKMKEIGYLKIPRHLEEALVAFIYFTKQNPELGDLSINPETEKRFNQYLTVYNYYGRNKTLLDKVMKNTEKNTFWYYLQFGVIKSDFQRSNQDKNIVY